MHIYLFVEAAGLSIGVVRFAGLFNACVDIIEKDYFYKNVGADLDHFSLASGPTGSGFDNKARSSE